ncbi:hypothetical protein [Rhodocaloribacter sp.]
MKPPFVMAKLYDVLNAIKASPLMRAPRRWSFDVRSMLAREPLLWPVYQPYIWWDQMNITSRGIAEARERVVGPHTEIVIDGYPGSANSFATAAFRNSQTRPVELAHHMHSPVQIIQGVRRGLPVIVTIRDPRGATLSLTSRWPHVSVEQGLRNYIRFYERLKPHLDGIVISTFERTTRGFDGVVAEVNERFGTNFDLFEPTEENLRKIRRPEKFETEGWRRRQEEKKRKEKDFETPRCRELHERAQALHDAYAAVAAARTVPKP